MASYSGKWSMSSEQSLQNLQSAREYFLIFRLKILSVFCAMGVACSSVSSVDIAHEGKSTMQLRYYSRGPSWPPSHCANRVPLIRNSSDVGFFSATYEPSSTASANNTTWPNPVSRAHFAMALMVLRVNLSGDCCSKRTAVAVDDALEILWTDIKNTFILGTRWSPVKLLELCNKAW